MLLCQEHTIYNDTTGNQGLIEERRSDSGKTMVPKTPLWTLVAKTELQLTTTTTSQVRSSLLHIFVSLILSLYISLVKFKL